MRIRWMTLIVALGVFVGCGEKESKSAIAFEVFCEMVANDAKPIALGHPMEAAQLDEVWDDF